MKQKILFLFVLFAGVSEVEALNLQSARREKGISYLEYMEHARELSLQQSQRLNSSPVDLAKEYKSAQLPAAILWPSQEEMQSRFERARDVRWLTTDEHPEFLRRSSWLYPDDGCFARAALANRNFKTWTIDVPNKVFVFGDLSVKTDNSPTGSVEWWYHVAPLVEWNGQKYVLDPALNPQQPLPLLEWLGLMSDDPESLRVAVCESGTYFPFDSCDTVTDGVEGRAHSDQLYYLDAEWRRLLDLRRNPNEELGDNPPWKNSFEFDLLAI